MKKELMSFQRDKLVHTAYSQVSIKQASSLTVFSTVKRASLFNRGLRVHQNMIYYPLFFKTLLPMHRVGFPKELLLDAPQISSNPRNHQFLTYAL